MLISRGNDLADGIGIGCCVVEDFLDEPQACHYTVFEGGVRVGLAKDGETIAQADVVIVETRPMIERSPHLHALGLPSATTGYSAPATSTTASPGATAEARVAVVVVVPAVFIFDLLGDGWKPIATQHFVDLGIRIWVQWRRISHVVGMASAVGCVQVDCNVGIVVIHHLNQRSCLRRVELHVVTVQVVALRVRALSHTCYRAILRAAVVYLYEFVAISVVEGCDQEHQ